VIRLAAALVLFAGTSLAANVASPGSAEMIVVRFEVGKLVIARRISPPNKRKLIGG